MALRRFAVLKAGTAPRETRNRRGDYDRLFIEALAGPGEDWAVHDVEHGSFPPDSAAYDGIVITGGRYSAYDDLPWMRRLLELVREIHGGGQALLGVCLGHQVLAQALGGEVQPSPLGWDIGVRTVTLTPSGRRVPGLAGAPRPLRVLELHRDVVTRLPAGAVRLARSRNTPHEMFGLGERTLGIQGHPEYDADVIRAALAGLRQVRLLTEEEAQRFEATLVKQPDSDFLRQWLRAFLRAGRRPGVA